VTERGADVRYPRGGHSACFAVEDRSFWFQHRNEVIRALCTRWPAPGPVADVGGGNGVVAAHLAAAGLDVLVVEPGADGCRNARARGVPRVVQATLRDAGLRPGEVGAVGAFDVLEHLDDPADLLRTAHALLPPGGRLYATVPAYRLLWSDADVEAGHVTRPTAGSLARLVADAGFRVDFTTYFFAPLVPAVALLRALPWRLGLRRRGAIESAARDHDPDQLSVRAMAPALRWELRRIAAGRRVPVGASVGLVATR
jgi:SAM-dependent methyltransferase